jgi:hypothetical protein
VLPRISTALSQFIGPVASSQPQDNVAPRREREPRDQKSLFQRFRPPKQEQPAATQAQPPAPAPVPPGTPGGPPPGSTAPNLSVASAFLQLFSFLRGNRDAFTHGSARSAYQTSVSRSRKGPKLRRGTMLDLKVD